TYFILLHFSSISHFYSVFLFSFYYSLHHPHLHSFPTRRSSDLQVPVSFNFTAIDNLAPWSLCNVSVDNSTIISNLNATNNTPKRSEEHTSELQSPYDLVCRLLLEKKKKKKTYKKKKQ